MRTQSSFQMQDRIQALLFLCLILFLFLMIRLFYLQVIRGENFLKSSEANRTTLIFEQAPRGLIEDRSGKIMASNRPTFVVLLMPIELKKTVLLRTIDRLEKLLQLKEGELKNRLKLATHRGSLVRVMDRVPRDLAFSLLEHQSELPGVSVVTEMQRFYPQGSVASHLLGYLGKVDPEEEENNPAGTEGPRGEFVGKMGMEKVYDSFLQGKQGGMLVEVDVLGRPLRVLEHKSPVPGSTIVTTIDLDLQKVAENSLAQTEKSGAVVAINPQNGEILAFASSPSFDPNLFLSKGVDTANGESVRDLLEDERFPFLNRGIQAQYAPGSVFKIVVAAAALESKKITLEQTIFCPGHFILGGTGGRKFFCWKKEGHGPMNLIDAIVNSCDVYFYHLGLNLGPDRIEWMAKLFSLGHGTGLELPGEKKGFVPGRTMFKTGKRRWFDGDTVNMAIGQGTLLVTPLQAAQLISIVATRGHGFRPHLVREIRGPQGETIQSRLPEPLQPLSLSPETWNTLFHALTEVVERGTGQACKIPGISIAGKTGTAQNPNGEDHAWFVAFAPVDHPKVGVAVLVEHGGHGSSAAAPIARDIFQAALVSPKVQHG